MNSPLKQIILVIIQNLLPKIESPGGQIPKFSNEMLVLCNWFDNLAKLSMQSKGGLNSYSEGEV